MRVEARATPALLEWARNTAGYSLDDAAHKIGVKTSKLRSWEKGYSLPTITQLRKISDVYKRPLAVFFLNAPPGDIELPSDYRKLDVSASPPPSTELRFAIREANSRRESALELFEDLAVQPTRFSIKAARSDDPEAVAGRIRRALVRSQTPPKGDGRRVFNYWRTAAEDAGILVFQAERIELTEMRGFSVSERPLPVVVLNIKDAFAGRVFSLMHEIAHIVIRQPGLCLLEEGSASEAQRIEKFCNHVAGAVLLPASVFLELPEVPTTKVSKVSDDVLKSLALHFSVSEETVLRRLVILGRVSPVYYDQKRAEFLRSYSALKKLKAKSKVRKSPSRMAVALGGKLFARLVLDAYDEERITSSDVAEYLGVRLKHFERIRAAVEPPSTGHEDDL